MNTSQANIRGSGARKWKKFIPLHLSEEQNLNGGHFGYTVRMTHTTALAIAARILINLSHPVVKVFFCPV